MIITGPQSSCQFLMWVTTMSIGCHIKTLCPNNCGWYSLSTNEHCWLSLLWHMGSGKKLATHLHPMPRLRMCGTMPPLHIHLHSVVRNKSQGNFTLLLQKGYHFLYCKQTCFEVLVIINLYCKMYSGRKQILGKLTNFTSPWIRAVRNYISRHLPQQTKMFYLYFFLD